MEITENICLFKLLKCNDDREFCSLKTISFSDTSLPSEFTNQFGIRLHNDDNGCIKMLLTGNAVILFGCLFRHKSEGICY